MRRFRVIAFDLDDTLLDTSKQIIPFAAKESCQAMIAAGLNTDLDSCLRFREFLLQNTPRSAVFDQIVLHFGVRSNSPEQKVIPAHEVVRAGVDAFYNRTVKEDLKWEPQIKQMVQDLGSIYKLYLVTSGHPETQEQKITKLEAAPLFRQIFFVDSSKHETKQAAFQKILMESQIPAEACLSVGNRVDTDLGEAKVLGFKTCWVRYGEYANLLPQKIEEQPDYTIEDLSDLRRVCLL